jgi:cellulose synthase/poly-beta-1,6-N-acetylglucosamine synthase-like glycosyltransferase
MTGIWIFAASAALIAWVYVGYAILLVALGHLRPRPRLRAPLLKPITVIVPAHNEEAVIERKVLNVLTGSYPRHLIEVIVASDGSSDRTVELARRAGATVLDLPRSGKVAALSAAVTHADGEILVFTDADCLLEPRSLAELVANFADPSVGGATANEVRRGIDDLGAVSRGEGFYWRYEQWIKRHEDRVGSTVSACGSLYAVRRSLFSAPTAAAGNDDVLISAEVVRSGHRLVFDEHALVVVKSTKRGADEFRRKVRIINGGLRTWLSLGELLDPRRYGLYALQVWSRKILRRLLPFALLVLFVSSAWLAVSEPWWWIVFAPQLLFALLASSGWCLRQRRAGRHRALWIPYYFALANTAAGVAVLSLAAGVRFDRWKPSGRDEIDLKTPAG